MAEFKLAVNDNNNATELPLCRVCGSVAENAHMRAFWAATVSYFLAFLGWFALAPLALDVAHSLKICENQKFPPADYPTRKAYVTFKNLKTEEKYCCYGAKDDDSDCLPAPVGKQGMYAPEVLTKCVCTSGTECRAVLGDAGVASVASTIFAPFALGMLLERFGPVNVQTAIMTYVAFWVAMAAAINAPWNFILIRYFIGAAGATFVTNQFWLSLMFAPNVVGTANATAAGWGKLGGGVTQFFMVIFLFDPLVSAGLEENVAWRVSMLVPALLLLLIAVTMKLLCWDEPTYPRLGMEFPVIEESSLMDYVEVLKDPRVLVMIFQYSACFGTELAMNNQLATHFRTYFQMKAAEASLLASAFGLMSLFARSLGGIGSHLLFKLVGFRGRIWAQFLALFFEAVFLFGFGLVDNGQPRGRALAVLVCLSLFVQMAEGTSYSIVPFMSKRRLAACVSAVVGAGGNLGAVVVGVLIYRPIEDPLLPFQVHAGYVMFCALLSPLYYWPEYGGMFCGPKAGSQAEGNEA